MGLFLEHSPKTSKAGGLSFVMLIVLGRLHTMLISKSTHTNCDVLHILTKCHCPNMFKSICPIGTDATQKYHRNITFIQLYQCFLVCWHIDNFY